MSLGILFSCVYVSMSLMKNETEEQEGKRDIIRRNEYPHLYYHCESYLILWDRKGTPKKNQETAFDLYFFLFPFLVTSY